MKKLSYLLLALLLGNTAMAQIQFSETFDKAETIDNELTWKKFNVDTSNQSGGGYEPWFPISSIKRVYFKKGYAVYSHSKSIGTYFAESAFGGANNRGLIDDWIVSQQLIDISTEDTLFYWAGCTGYSVPTPTVPLVPKNDTLEVWLNQGGKDPMNKKVRLDVFALQDSAPIWRPRIIPLKGLVTTGKYYLSFRHYLKNAGNEEGKNGSEIWLDDIVIGKNMPKIVSNNGGFVSNVAGVSNNAVPLLQIYPNPAGEFTNIVPALSGTLRICDVLGVVIWQGVCIQGQTVSLNTGNYAPGVYLVQLLNKNQLLASQKLLVK